MKIVVGDEVFGSKKALTEKVCSILWAYKPGQTISDEHHKFIYALLLRHSHAAEKIGPGVVRTIIHDNGFKSQGFSVVRVDGSIESFSYTVCITPNTPDKKVNSTFRREIVDQVLAVKKKAFVNKVTITCPVTNTSITWDECHIDHEPPATFEVLVDRFLANRNISPEAIQIAKFGMGRFAFIDRELASAWQHFHKQHAILRAVSKRANLSDIRKAAQ